MSKPLERIPPVTVEYAEPVVGSVIRFRRMSGLRCAAVRTSHNEWHVAGKSHAFSWPELQKFITCYGSMDTVEVLS